MSKSGHDGYLIGTDADRKFIEHALRRGATRRDVVRMMLAAGAGLGFAGGLVTEVGDALAATPKRGGNIRFAWPQHGPADTLDPIQNSNSIDYARGRLTYNNLCRLREDLTAAPELAESFEANADATEWVFKLRKDVEWHDGSKLTADDVVYSMNRHLGADTKSVAKVLVADVKEWVKEDNHTVRAKLNVSNSELPVVLGTFHFKIIKNGTTEFQTAVGTGPFRLTEFKPGVRSIHDRNDNYWGNAGPYLDRVEVFGITDNNARLNALLAGDIHMMGNLDPKGVGQVKAADGLEVFSVASGAYDNIVARLDQSPGNNPDFVLGLKYLQRRDRILRVVRKGEGSIGNDHPVGPAYGADHCDGLPVRAYDPDKAKFHLKKSGLTSAELHVAEITPATKDVALILQQECAKVGFDLQLNQVPNDGYWGATWLKKPMFVASWNMRPSANIMMTIAFKSDAPWNESRWKNERFDQLLNMARAELDPAKRHEMHCEMQTLCHNESGVMIPAHNAYTDAKIANLKGFPRVPLSAFGGMEWPEFAWLDA